MGTKIFDKLNKTNIPYAICIGIYKSTIEEDRQGLDCFLIAPASKLSELIKYGFKANKEEDQRYLCESLICVRNLSRDDYKAFKKIIHTYHQAIDNRFGRVYEVKGNSLSELLKKQKRESILFNSNNHIQMKEKNYG